jgi:hypothetical protein
MPVPETHKGDHPEPSKRNYHISTGLPTRLLRTRRRSPEWGRALVAVGTTRADDWAT